MTATTRRAARSYPAPKFSSPVDQARFDAWSRAQRERTSIAPIEACACGCRFPARFCPNRPVETVAASSH